jgi:hypothetical protein
LASIHSIWSPSSVLQRRRTAVATSRWLVLPMPQQLL